MKENNTKEGVEKNKNSKKMRKKVKRQISIFTVMLWIFLITTMITITVNSTKKTNALEVEDENWNIQLVMYDRSSDTPNNAITEFTWNATSNTEEKQLCMQINYACTTNKGYQPGEIEITIPGISKESFSEYWRDLDYKNWLSDKVTIAADKTTDTTKRYDWSYSYDDVNNIYTFINNVVIEENEHFEGTIQIVYNLEPRFKIRTDLEFKAKIKENIENAEEIIAKESNICNFHYTSTKKIYNLTKSANAAPRTDFTKIEDILDNYYWVGYNFRINFDEKILYSYNEEGKRISYNSDNNCIKETLPSGCVLYDKYLNKIEPRENNTYYYLKANDMSYVYYVGYPKDIYNEGDKITNTAEIWGRYEDEEEIQKLAEASATVNLVDFDFEYKGNLYGIDKVNISRNTYVNKIKDKKGVITDWNLTEITSFYAGKTMDVEIGDDLLYITRENGDVTKLNDDEYNFSRIDIPIFYTYNKYTGASGDVLIGYNYEIQVRYKDSNEYVVYSESITNDKNKYIEFKRDDIVGVKLVIKDLDKTLNRAFMKVYTNIHTKDCAVGKIYNFDYLQVYEKDDDGNRTLVNEPTENSYKTPSTLKIAKYDMDTYGKYMQRDYASMQIIDGNFNLSVSKSHATVTNNVKEEKYEVDYELNCFLDLEYYDVKKDVIIKQYDILPSGMKLANDEEEIIKSITSDGLPYENLKLKDGTVFNTEEEFEKYLRKNTTVDIDYNYKDSGRTKVSIKYNLNDIDWSYYLLYSFKGSSYFRSISTIIKVEIPYDSILEYGTRYINYVYEMWNNQEYSYRSHIISDRGGYDSIASDIDNDGDIKEELTYYSNILNITHAVSSQQAVIKQVRTDLTKGKFIEGTAEATAGSEYTYKLRVTTGANSLKDLIIYDTLETIYDESGNDISSGWKGEFLNVDTSYAVSKGYAPVVYYSEEQNPGKLTEVPDKWQLLTENTDKSTVKSICVDLRYKVDGTEMELSPNNVVFVLINMQAPSDDTIITSANNMFKTNWRAIDPLGTVIDNVEGIYSNQVNVEIHKEDIRTNISGSKTWKDENNKYGVRPESITVKLLQDGVEYETKTVTSEDNWNYTFENIPVYSSNTHAYEYEIIEENVDNYITEYDGNNITNKFVVPEEKVEIWVNKVWIDENNKYGKRPSSIILQVKNNGKVVKEAEVSLSDEWRYKFELPKYDELGNEIEYTVDERELNEGDLKYYNKEIKGNEIVNTNTYEEVTDTSDINIFVYVVIFFIAIIGIIIGIMFVRKNKVNKK